MVGHEAVRKKRKAFSGCSASELHVDDGDTHGWLRKWPPAQDQLVHFLQTGEVIDVCGGQPCVTGPQ